MAPLFWPLDKAIFEYDRISGTLVCFCIAVIYVGSLYLWTPSKYVHRDHPVVIKFRFVRVTIVCLLLFPFLWYCSTTSNHGVMARPLYVWVGIRIQGLLMSIIMPFLLTMLLFTGPLTLHYFDGVFNLYKDPKYWSSNIRNLVWVRNHIVAPLSEEFAFRACMLPFLVPSFGEYKAMFVCPLFFGVAHFHHLIEKIRNGSYVKTAVLHATFQFVYTTLFGTYSAFLFLRTNNLMAPVVAHAFCNHMCFPNFQEIFNHPQPRRTLIMLAFVGGLASWFMLLYTFTEPSLFQNTFYKV